MGTEREIYDWILGFARGEERVLAVYMNGSRVNPNVTKDPYQDYDIVYVVEETAPFLEDRGWITRWISGIGTAAMIQEPDSREMGWGGGADYSRSYIWLILFQDGTRIDLGIQTAEAVRETFGRDSLTKVLLDKKEILPKIPPPDDSTYWIQRPDRAQYAGCCNEFWWCLNNVAKGIAREQLPYVLHMYYEMVHKELDRMLEWYIGMNHQFQISCGMWGKYFRKYLPPHFYAAYEQTYSDSGYDHIWSSVFEACRLFRKAAKAVGEGLECPYPQEDDENMTAYLEMIKNGLKTAKKLL